MFVTWLGFFLKLKKTVNIALKNFVLISNKVTLIVTGESLERFVVHVNLRVYTFHSIQCLFIKEEIGKSVKVLHAVDKNSPLRRRGK